MSGVRLLLRVQLLMFICFVLNKFLIRPFVLENDFSEWLQILVLSFPNFCEAVMGSLILVYIGLIMKKRVGAKASEHQIYFTAVLFAAIYVILQEFKIHNLGGRNTYDPYDVLFSIIGLVTAYCFLVWTKPVLE